MNRQPVVITGVGVLACNGLGREAFWKSIEEGRSGIGTIDRFDASQLPCHIAGQLWDFNPEDFMKKTDVKHWHRHVHQSVAAARLSVEDSELQSANYDPERIAVCIGTSIGSPNEEYCKEQVAYEKLGWQKVSKFASSAFAGHSATVNVSVGFGLRGPAITIASGCATGLDCLSWGMRQIQLGHADAAVIGATESPIFPLAYASACSLGILSKRNDDPEGAMRPFDKGCDGIVLSEGAVVLVLEKADNARSRGAKIMAEVAGNGSAAEGLSPLILDKEGKGLARAIEQALAESGTRPEDIDAGFVHGVSLPMYDRSETNALKRALGKHSYRIPFSATKSMTGQPYAAGGLMGAAAALLSLDRGVVSPTINLEDPDPECDLDYVAQKTRINDVNTTLVTAISFGGTHSATVLRSLN